MELISYPFSLAVGALFVLVITSPIMFTIYKGTQLWIAWLTDDKFKIKTFVDTHMYYKADFNRMYLKTSCFSLFMIGGIYSVIALVFSFSRRLVHNEPILENLIFTCYELPVEFTTTIFPILFPVTLIWGASFGIRKAFRIADGINNRLKRVEK